MIHGKEHLHAIQAVPARAPRKAVHSHRSPSYNDAQPGHVFSLPFGSLRSQSPNISATSPVSAEGWEPNPTGAFCPDNATSASTDRHSIPDNHVKENNPHLPQHCSSPASSTRRAVSLSRVSTLPFSHSSLTSSLADEYLDTMVPNEFWRALCRRKVRQEQRKLQEIKRS